MFFFYMHLETRPNIVCVGVFNPERLVRLGLTW